MISSILHICIALTAAFIVCSENNEKMEIEGQITSLLNSEGFVIYFHAFMFRRGDGNHLEEELPRLIFDRVIRTMKGSRPCPHL